MKETHTILTWFEDKSEEQNLSEYLQKQGYRCISCQSKKQFDGIIETTLHNISLVIIDLSIKETDAILACNEIKSKNKKSAPFVIIVGDKTS